MKGQLTALLIICREKNIPTLKSFEEELLIVICCAPSYCLTNEIISAGSFCWSWISVIPEFSQSSLYLNLRYSLLMSINAGGIFDTSSIQSSLILDKIHTSIVLEFPRQRKFVEPLNRQANKFIREIPKEINTDVFGNLTYDEHSYNFSRDNLLEGFDVWLRFLVNQMKVLLFNN